MVLYLISTILSISWLSSLCCIISTLLNYTCIVIICVKCSLKKKVSNVKRQDIWSWFSDFRPLKEVYLSFERSASKLVVWLRGGKLLTASDGQISIEFLSKTHYLSLSILILVSLSQFGQRGGVVHKGGKAAGREDWASQGRGRRRVCNQKTGKKNKLPETTPALLRNPMRLTHLKDHKSTMIGVQNWWKMQR